MDKSMLEMKQTPVFGDDNLVSHQEFSKAKQGFSAL
jgi:hypothetical protein